MSCSTQIYLQDQVKMWPTPQASDNRDRGNLGSGAILRRKEKGKQIGLSQSVSDQSGALNPPWVEWLMGWPLEWTDLNPLETARFQAWLRSHGEFLANPPPKK
jgi:DNA (cytosine-5)-methyltransferase 1